MSRAAFTIAPDGTAILTVQVALGILIVASVTVLLKLTLWASNRRLNTMSRPFWSDDEVREMVQDGDIRGLHPACSHPVCMSLRWRYVRMREKVPSDEGEPGDSPGRSCRFPGELHHLFGQLSRDEACRNGTPHEEASHCPRRRGRRAEPYGM